MIKLSKTKIPPSLVLLLNDHVDIEKKVIKSAGVIAKICHFTNLNARKLCVYPYLLIYGNILIWVIHTQKEFKNQ
jgi:hypothetical protein